MKEELNFELKGTEWGKLQDAAFEKLNKKAKISGFRPGKAPKEVYIKNYGVQEILYEAADMAIKKEYERIIKEGKLLPVIEPKIDLVKLDEKEISIKFTFIVDPKVELGKYTDLGVKKEKVVVTAEEIKERTDALLNEYAELEVKEGKVENGDIAIIDFTGFKDGKEFEGGKSENYSLTIGSKTFIPGFEEAIIGMKTGEEKDIDLTFPEDYQAEELKGQKVVFKVKVNEIKNRVVPTLDKDFFDDLGMDGVTNKEELEKELSHEIEHQKEHEQEHIYEEKCLDKAVSNMKVELVQELIDDEVEHMYREFFERMSMQGITEEVYFEYTKQKKEDLTKQMAPEAEKRLKYRYLLKAVMEEEKIKVSDKDIDARLDEMATMYKVDKEQILKEVSRDNIRFDIMYQKALDVVCANSSKKETKKSTVEEK